MGLTRKPKTEPGLPEAYLVKLNGASEMIGMTKAVDFVHGHGVLDKTSVGIARPDFINPETGELVDPGFLDTLAKFWGNRGATVEPVSQAEADAYREKLGKNPKGHLPKEKVTKKVEAAPKTEAPKTGKGKQTGKPAPHQFGKE